MDPGPRRNCVTQNAKRKKDPSGPSTVPAEKSGPLTQNAKRKTHSKVGPIKLEYNQLAQNLKAIVRGPRVYIHQNSRPTAELTTPS